MSISELLEYAKTLKINDEYVGNLQKKLEELSANQPKQCSEQEFLQRSYNL